MSATAIIRTILRIKFTFAPSSTMEFLSATKPVHALVAKLPEFESLAFCKTRRCPANS